VIIIIILGLPAHQKREAEKHSGRRRAHMYHIPELG